jgi:hypothetical protein
MSIDVALSLSQALFALALGYAGVQLTLYPAETNLLKRRWKFYFFMLALFSLIATIVQGIRNDDNQKLASDREASLLREVSVTGKNAHNAEIAAQEAKYESKNVRYENFDTRSDIIDRNIRTQENLDQLLSEVRATNDLLAAELQELRHMAQPVKLILQGCVSSAESNGVSYFLIFRLSKNAPLGILQFIASIPSPADAKIIDFKPNMAAYTASKDSTFIDSDGKMARLTFSPIGGDGTPVIKLLVSTKTSFKISGNNRLEDTIIEPSRDCRSDVGGNH